MDIKTKFDVDDEAYMLHNNKVIRVKIVHIRINISTTTQIEYIVTHPEFYKGNDTYHESWLFATKEELLASL